MTNWYYLPYKDILNLIQIILRSSMMIKITAGKLVHMSIFTFGNVSYQFIYIYLYSPIVEKSATIPGNKNCLRIFQPVAPSHITQCIFDLLMRKLVKFKI